MPGESALVGFQGGHCQFLVAHQGHEGLTEAEKVPVGHLGLARKRVAALVVGVVADVARVVGIQKLEGAVVQRQAQDAHVVGVHHAMAKANRLPVRQQIGGALGHGSKQGSVGVARPGISPSALGMKSSITASANVRSAPCWLWWQKCSKCPKRMKLGATRATTAAVSASSRYTGLGEPVMHSAREVGMPKPCMASLHENSRRLLRSTARPSPMRENGVQPSALELQLQACQFPQQYRAAIAQLPRPHAELVAAVDAGNGLSAWGYVVAGHGLQPGIRFAPIRWQPQLGGNGLAACHPIRRRQRRRLHTGKKVFSKVAKRWPHGSLAKLSVGLGETSVIAGLSGIRARKCCDGGAMAVGKG